MKFIERLFSVLAWLQIFVSPAIIAAIAGTLIWLGLGGFWGAVLASAVGLTGCIIGIAFAEKARRDKGTVEFMSRTIAHPELREKEIVDDSSRIK
ncbi:MAG TPA: hypothetical protein VF629_09415 [Hymenobacter sp.]|jgi:predicted methyltransferase|uniref:hypothetical protein n=1 Tax=Hymenobacter sp. TaxID=1898978 RepID=UPI002EDA0B83